jgi:chain length determinant protein (polysaccharide antigen chain regulator)
VTDDNYQHQAPRNDEIDLVELLYGLWTQKWLILLVTLAVSAGATAYAFLAKPVYATRVTVMPPSLSEIADFNLGRNGGTGLKPFSVSDVYAVFTRNLQAEKNRRQFFREVYLQSLDEARRSGSHDALYKGFAATFSISAPNKSQPDLYSVAVEHHDPAQAAAWAKHYVDQVAQQSLDEMLKNAQRELAVHAQNIEQQIEGRRESAKARREDRITQLHEALTVAEAIGLENPPVITGRTEDNRELSAFMDGSLMYMRGSKALQAELRVLKARESDDPFIPELRDLEEKYKLYASVKLDPERVAVFRQDGEVEQPDAPIKPKKALILALGVVLGGMLGLFIALIRLMLKKRLPHS